jgi:hypothetical protein
VTGKSREVRLAENEALAREVNEQVEKISSRWHRRDELIDLICECSSATCTDRVHVSLKDYHRVRANPTQFIVVDEHAVPDIETRVGVAGDAIVVEKIGIGRDVAIDEA